MPEGESLHTGLLMLLRQAAWLSVPPHPNGIRSLVVAKEELLWTRRRVEEPDSVLYQLQGSLRFLIPKS